MSRPAGGFAAVLARRDVAPLVAASLVGRLPLGMAPIGLVLLLRAHGSSYATVGAVVAAYSIGLAGATPLLGRGVDSFGRRRVLLPLSLAFPVLLAAEIAAINGGAPGVAWMALAALAGAVLPPLGATMRALWPQLVETPDLRSSAYAFEATVQEVAFIAGPLIVAAVAAAASPTAALVACAAAGALGGAPFALLSARLPAAPYESRRQGALRPPGVRTLLIASVGLGVAFGAFEVAMPAFAERHGSRAVAGVLVGLYALGSLLGGIWATRFPPRDGQLRRYLISLVCLAVAMAPLFAAQSIVAMAILALAAGAPIAPGFAAAYSMLDEFAAAGTATETFAWITTTIVAGSAGGTALGGWLIHTGGYRAALLLGLLTVVTAAVLTLARRETLVKMSLRRRPGALA